MPKAIYKGDRECPDNYDNFTLDKEYDILFPPEKDYDETGEIVVFNDKGELVRQPGIDFDFID